MNIKLLKPMLILSFSAFKDTTYELEQVLNFTVL